jgi:hypothetical protein
VSAWRFYLGIGGLMLVGHIAGSVAALFLGEILP